MVPSEVGRWNSIVVPSSTGPLSLLKVSQQRSLGPAYEHGQWQLLVFGACSAHHPVAYIYVCQ